MRRLLFTSAMALTLCAGYAAAQHPPDQPTPPGRATAPDHTIPPTGAAQPQAPLADQAKPAAVGPSQANTAGSMPEHQVPGATRQTMPSTISAENAAQDKLPTAAFQFPLSPEQKRMIAASVAKMPVATASGDARLTVSSKLPHALESSMQEFPGDVTQRLPEAAKYKYVKLPQGLLIVDPPNHTVVGEIATQN